MQARITKLGNYGDYSVSELASFMALMFILSVPKLNSLLDHLNKKL